MGWRLKRSDHEKLLKKTLGKNNKPLSIFDGTAGLLSDSINFFSPRTQSNCMRAKHNSFFTSLRRS